MLKNNAGQPYDKAEHQQHLVQMGEVNIRKCIELSKTNRCRNPKCSVDNLFFDLTDEQIEGASKLFARILHFHAGNIVQMFQHLVVEMESRRELKAEVLETQEAS